MNASLVNTDRSYTSALPLLRVLVVDDEPVARKVLRQELEVLPNVEVIGEADNGETALLQISALKPDLVLLDIQMPVMGGFELLTHLTGGSMPAIIMDTAFDQHAVRAFEAGAVDYLLKPVAQTRLRQALERGRRLQGNPRAAAENIAQLQQIVQPYRFVDRGASTQDCRQSRRRVFPAKPRGSTRLSSRRRSGLDCHRQETLSRYSKLENAGRTADQRFVPACPPQRLSQRKPDP